MRTPSSYHLQDASEPERKVSSRFTDLPKEKFHGDISQMFGASSMSWVNAGSGGTGNEDPHLRHRSLGVSFENGSRSLS